ncbi:MAG: protein kinase domain-containing protein [Gemmatimonadota bacterium]
MDLLDRLTADSSFSDRYRVEREIGSGGMATVWLAHDRRHDRRVAIKVLRPELSVSLGAERFHREIRIVAALQHPHIVPLFDSGESGGLLYYVMPFVEGATLRDRLERERELPVGETVRIMRDIADALAAAHQVGVIHRDLKPENIMLSGRHALVTDFGVARALSESADTRVSTFGVALGTPAYMSPEQATADPNVDHRTDIYAFGICAWEMLCGSAPFSGRTPREILASQVSIKPDPPAAHRPGIPQQLDALITRCLEKRPADRYQTAEELIPQLETLLSPSGSAGIPVTPTSLPPARNHPHLRVATIAGAAIVAVGVLTMLAVRDPPLEAGRVLVAPFEAGAGASLGALREALESAITEGLQRTGRVIAIDRRSAAGETGSRDTTATSLAAPAAARRLAREVRAGLMVGGRIVAVGDSVRIESRLVSTATGSEQVTISTETGALSASGELVARVTQRLMGALVLHRDPQWGSAIPGTRAPTYIAYRQFQEGVDAINRGDASSAAQRFFQAWTNDTMFVVAAIRYGYALLSLGRNADVDSIGVRLEPRRGSMSTFETQYLNRLLAWNRGDLQSVYTAGQEIRRIAPQSNFARYTAARSAMFVNRMSDAREGLSGLDLESPDLGGVQGGYGDLTEVDHHLSDHEGELRVAQEWVDHPRNRLPLRALAAEGNALAALGRLDEVRELFPQFLTARAEGNTRPVTFALALIRELRWHGYPQEAAERARLALAMLSGQLTPNERLLLLTAAGQTSQAVVLADSLRRVDARNGVARSWRGALAAMLNDRATATSVLREIESDETAGDRGSRAADRAGILALLGEKDAAVQLLRQAHAEGTSFQGNAFHARIGLEPLRGFAAFEEFVRAR